MSKAFSPAALAECRSYERNEVRAALEKVIALAGGLDWVKPGMRIALKANLIAGGEPEKAITTHPAVLAELCRILKERGAAGVVGDSPGGVFTEGFVGSIYRRSGLTICLEAGGELNGDFSTEQRENPEGKAARLLDCTSWIFSCDGLINVCKLKTHGMMNFSGAVKNLFGTVPGTIKPEYHFRYPEVSAFADMLIDIDEFYRPALNIMDAVVGMEGNGPTAGKPREVGCLIASVSPYSLDLLAAGLIGLTAADVPTLEAAAKRGLAPEELSELPLLGDPASSFMIADYDLIRERRSLKFAGKGPLGRLKGAIFGKVMETRPKADASCIGCGKCAGVCPAKAIVMRGKRPDIRREKCIKCFCCQEFCPVGAMKVHRTLPARLLQKSGAGKKR